MGEIGEPVRGEQVFQFQAIDAGGIGLFDVIVIVIVVEFVDDPDAEGMRVGEGAKVDARYVEVAGVAEIAYI